MALGLKAISNFDYAVLLCDDMAAMKAFYRDVMGFQIEHDQEKWVSFRVGTTLFTLRPRGKGPAWDDGPAIPGSASVQLAFRVPPSNLDDCHTELLDNDVDIVMEPTDLPAWRHRAIFFRDPGGNIVEIYAEY
ncbi:VOC family protein [Salininema proteolyticum]|uniref:VOC family protein n=1 Tax=Salininema proteolyticum TaxID=1607685 RepID=A0ABV8TTD9_9ACTN